MPELISDLPNRLGEIKLGQVASYLSLGQVVFVERKVGVREFVFSIQGPTTTKKVEKTLL